jgi:SAM-dependent methyltransferase
MTTIVNTQQLEMWNGYEGIRWAEQADRWDSLNGVFNADLFDTAAIGPDDTVLDIGCGTGETTRLAAWKTTRETVGIDLSVPMLERARAAAEAECLDNVRFEHGDAQVYPFPPGTFDVVIARFGLTFFAEPVAALRHIGTVMRPGGRLASVLVGDYNAGDWAPVMAKSLPLPFLDEPNPRDALADEASIVEVLTEAGFVEVNAKSIVRHNVWGSDPRDAADFLLHFGPIHFVVDQVDPATARQAEEAVAAAFEPYQTAEGVRMGTPAFLVRAVRR